MHGFWLVLEQLLIKKRLRNFKVFRIDVTKTVQRRRVYLTDLLYATLTISLHFVGNWLCSENVFWIPQHNCGSISLISLYFKGENKFTRRRTMSPHEFLKYISSLRENSATVFWIRRQCEQQLIKFRFQDKSCFCQGAEKHFVCSTLLPGTFGFWMHSSFIFNLQTYCFSYSSTQHAEIQNQSHI